MHARVSSALEKIYCWQEVARIGQAGRRAVLGAARAMMEIPPLQSLHRVPVGRNLDATHA